MVSELRDLRRETLDAALKDFDEASLPYLPLSSCRADNCRCLQTLVVGFDVECNIQVGAVVEYPVIPRQNLRKFAGIRASMN